jgi:hypothetical protein
VKLGAVTGQALPPCGGGGAATQLRHLQARLWDWIQSALLARREAREVAGLGPSRGGRYR